MSYDELLNKMNEAGETGYNRAGHGGAPVRKETFGGMKVGDIVTMKPGARWMGSNSADYPLKDGWEPQGTGEIRELIDTGTPTAVVRFTGGKIITDARNLILREEPESKPEPKPSIPSAMDQSARGAQLG